VKVVVLTRNPRGIASQFIARRSIDVVGVLLDEGKARDRRAHARRRLRKLRRLGPTAVPVGLALRRTYEAASGDQPEIWELGVPVTRIPTLNDGDARAQLRALGPELAVSLDCGVLEKATFALPTLGTINVHHGRVPNYRGGPPVFWELVDGLSSVGFTVHRVDPGIDTGPVLEEGEVPILRRPTLRATLSATIPLLHEASLDALERVLRALSDGVADERPQPADGTFRSTPTFRAYLSVRRSLRDEHGYVG
jgi:hypothetical protein